MSCVFFGAVTFHLWLRFLFYWEFSQMNILILDIKNEALIQPLKENNHLKVVTGTIRRPKLYPIPDVILLNFDEVFGYERRETILIEIAAKLHPQVTIIACSKEWCDGTKKFAKQFGVDDCFDSNKIKELLYRIDIYRKAYDAV